MRLVSGELHAHMGPIVIVPSRPGGRFKSTNSVAERTELDTTRRFRTAYIPA